MHRHLLLITLALGSFLTAVSGGAQTASRAASYRIGPKDLVEIRVLEEASLNVQLRVSNEGTINLPLMGDFQVGGLTAEEAAAALKTLLENDYLQRATVSLNVVEFRSRPISVLGAVKQPGNLVRAGRWTLLEALTDAGGLDLNHGPVVYITRRSDNGLSDQLAVNLDDLLVRADPRVNIPVFANDVITVPAAAEVTVFIMGAVESTGAVTFKSSEHMTLLAALAQAGGLTDRASNKISVKRLRDDGTRNEIIIGYKRLLRGEEPDLELQDGDVILVKESFF